MRRQTPLATRTATQSSKPANQNFQSIITNATTKRPSANAMMSIIGGQLVSRTGKFKTQMIVGSAVGLAAIVPMQTLKVASPTSRISLFMVIFGLGGGLVGLTVSVVVQISVSRTFIGVATGSRQFFMQIGQVMGVAIFGLVFTTTYGSAFSAETASTLAQAGATEQFNDPTLALDVRSSRQVSAEVMASPNGAAALTAATKAQKDAVASATERLFLGSTFAGLVVLIIAISMKEIPLRRTFSTAEPGHERAPVALEPELG